MRGSTIMFEEIHQVPQRVADLLTRRAAIRHAAAMMKQRDPLCFVTSARGSSDNAALFFKYLMEQATGIPVASMGPSVASVFATPLRLRNAVVLTISQSGRSPDLLAFQKAAKAGGALTVALVNDENSPAAQAADIVIPVGAGPELSVAATKSFMCTLTVAALLVADFADQPALAAALLNLPSCLESAARLPWSLAVPSLPPSMYTAGRGVSLAVAAEAALKLKETTAIHAEAFSLAEMMHGPIRIAGHGFPVLSFLCKDGTAQEGKRILRRLIENNAPVYAAGAACRGVTPLETIDTGHEATDAIAMTQSFYILAEELARRSGNDPDRPAGLSKVTETL